MKTGVRGTNSCMVAALLSELQFCPPGKSHKQGSLTADKDIPIHLTTCSVHH